MSDTRTADRRRADPRPPAGAAGALPAARRSRRSPSPGCCCGTASVGQRRQRRPRRALRDATPSRCPRSSSTGGCARTVSLLAHRALPRRPRRRLVAGPATRVRPAPPAQRRHRGAAALALRLLPHPDRRARRPRARLGRRRRPTLDLGALPAPARRRAAGRHRGTSAQHVLAVEERVVRAFGSREEIAAARDRRAWPTADGSADADGRSP